MSEVRLPALNVLSTGIGDLFHARLAIHFRLIRRTVAQCTAQAGGRDKLGGFWGDGGAPATASEGMGRLDVLRRARGHGGDRNIQSTVRSINIALFLAMTSCHSCGHDYDNMLVAKPTGNETCTSRLNAGCQTLGCGWQRREGMCRFIPNLGRNRPASAKLWPFVSLHRHRPNLSRTCKNKAEVGQHRATFGPGRGRILGPEGLLHSSL